MVLLGGFYSIDGEINIRSEAASAILLGEIAECSQNLEAKIPRLLPEMHSEQGNTITVLLVGKNMVRSTQA